MKPRDTDIPISLLEQLFVYLPKHGLLIYREKPREAFPSKAHWISWNRAYSGKTATYSHCGYLAVNVGRRRVLAHRVIWALQTGAWPDDRIDHRNGEGTANRLENLRPATMPQQMQNKAGYKNNFSSGLTGASWSKAHRRWVSYINVGGKRRHLGYFDTPEEAHSAYLKAKQELHPFQPTPR